MDMDSRELDSPLVDLDALSDIRADLHDDLHIQAVVGSDRDSPNSLKRACSDSNADSDQNTAKKRRKQSKPVRINAPDEAPSGGGDVPGLVLGAPEHHDHQGADERVSPSLDLEVQVHCQTDGDPLGSVGPREEIPLNLCSLPKTEPSSPTALEDLAVFTGKSGSPVGLEVVSPMDMPGPSQQPTHFWGMSTPFLYPMIAPPHEQQGSHHQSRCSPDNRTGSCTIFNPDAYCELCNKEFCNKYFLKTHKANKHGIFTNSTTQQQQQTPSQQQQPHQQQPQQQQQQQQPQQPQQQQQIQQQQMQQQQMQQQQVQQQQIQQQQVQLQQVQQQQSCVNTPDPSAPGFQHGLLPPRTLSPNGEPLMKIGSSPIRLQKDLLSSKHSNKLFHRKIKVKSFGTNGEDTSLPSGERVKVEDDFYDTDVERILNRMSPQISNKDLLLQQGDSVGSLRLTDREDLPQSSKGLVYEEGGEMGSAGDSNESTGVIRKEAQSQEIGDKPVFTPEKMRSLGVINPEAFCEICCKEYCNKYFLRTHKWKRHGIAPPEGEEKDGSRSAPSWLQQMQQHAAPLNLIMEDPATSNWDSQPRHSGDAMCKYCGQWFPSDQVLQVHVAFVHLANKKEKEPGDFPDVMNRKAEETDKSVDRAARVGGERKTDQIESIMDDMKKVQTMLYQLNSLNAGQMGVHSEDTRTPAMNSSIPEPGPSSIVKNTPRSASPVVVPHVPCGVCKKSFPDKNTLQQHIQEQHWSATQVKVERDVEPVAVPGPVPGSVPPQVPNRPAEGAPDQPESKTVASAPTSSYCEICNKELCNKYFMKTHMQRMHGIEIENGSQIGGVVCDICNKELCSKYFLRVHKQNTHGIVDESSGPPTQVRDNGSLFNMTGGHFMDANNQALKPTDLSEMSHRYFTHFNEVCSICNRRFRSVKWLKAHLINDHGRSEFEATAETNDRLSKLPPPPPAIHPNELSAQLGLGPNGFNMPRERSRGSEGKSRHRMAQDGNPHSSKNGNHFLSNLMQVASTSSKEYRCSYCPFSTPVLAFLYVHEKTHTGLAYLPSAEQKRDLQCPVCFKNFTKPEQFQRHILSHQFPAGLPNPMFGSLDPRSIMFQPPPQKESKREKPRATSERIEEPPADLDDRVPSRRGESPSSGSGQQEKRDRRCIKCTKCAAEIPLSGEPGADRRCPTCGEGTRRDKDRDVDLSSLQTLLKETVTSDVKKRLEDAAKLNDIPASYAVPKKQDADSNPFIMQPFIIEEPRGEQEDQGAPGAGPFVDKKFVPSLVFLPVKERLSRPLTASFTLTPA